MFLSEEDREEWLDIHVRVACVDMEGSLSLYTVYSTSCELLYVCRGFQYVILSVLVKSSLRVQPGTLRTKLHTHIIITCHDPDGAVFEQPKTSMWCATRGSARGSY